MTEQSLADVVERVRKLRALSTSDNPHESAAATAVADRLIQQHRLEEAVLEVLGPPDECTLDPDPVIRWKSRRHTWEAVLGNASAVHYDAAGVITWQNKQRVFVLVGSPDDVRLARDLYQWVHSEILRLSYLPRTRVLRYVGRELNSFRMGAVVGVIEALAAMKRELAETAPTAALVLASRRQAALAFVSARGARNLRMDAPLSRSAYQQGQEAGRGIEVSDSRRRRLGTGSRA